jgi:hypothetical protein
LVAPELVHARLDDALAVDLPYQIRELSRELIGRSANPGDTVRQSLDRFGGSLSARCTPMARIFVDSLRNGFSELVADLVLWRSVHLAGDVPSEALRRFWFIYGPGVISAATATFGIDRASICAIQYLITRSFFLNYLIYRASERERLPEDSQPEWVRTFHKMLTTLGDLEFHLEDFPSTYELPYGDRSMIHLHCLRLDLRIPDEKWLTAVAVLRRSFESVEAGNGEVLAALGSWLDYAQDLVDQWLLKDTRDSAARSLYNEYLAALVADWPTSDPWPPHIEHHDVEVVEGRNQSVDRSRIREDDPGGGFISLRGGVLVRDPAGSLEAQRVYHVKTGVLIKRLADHVRRLRFQELRDAL